MPYSHLLSLLSIIFLISTIKCDVINDLPTIQECQAGKRFIVNHILFVCHQFGERRSFKPFACATENDIATAQLIGGNTTHNERFFRYKCERIACLLSDVHVTPGTTIRRGQTEYSCVLDNVFYMKLIQRRMLHDFCMPGNQNDTLLENDACPGISVGATHAKFGSGTEVVFDFHYKTIIDPDLNL